MTSETFIAVDKERSNTFVPLWIGGQDSLRCRLIRSGLMQPAANRRPDILPFRCCADQKVKQVQKGNKTFNFKREPIRGYNKAIQIAERWSTSLQGCGGGEPRFDDDEGAGSE
jgi:hypothetical protein